MELCQELLDRLVDARFVRLQLSRIHSLDHTAQCDSLFDTLRLEPHAPVEANRGLEWYMRREAGQEGVLRAEKSSVSHSPARADSLSTKLQGALDHQSALELSEPFGFARRRVNTFDFRFHVAARDRYPRVNKCSDLLSVHLKAATNFEIRFAPLRSSLEGKSVQARHVRAPQVDSIALRMSSDDRAENEIALGRDVALRFSGDPHALALVLALR